MKTKTQIAAVLIILGSLVSGLSAGDYYKHLKVKTYSQKKNCWCAIATVAMWTDWLEDPEMKDDQAAISEEIYGTSTECPSRGMTTSELADALEEFSWNWFGSYRTSSKYTFVSKIVSEIHSGDPVAIPVYTRYTNGTEWKKNGHYVIIDAFSNNQSQYSSSYSKVDEFYINDSAYNFKNNKPLYTYIDATGPTEKILKNELFTDYVSTYNGRYYLVDD